MWAQIINFAILGQVNKFTLFLSIALLQRMFVMQPSVGALHTPPRLALHKLLRGLGGGLYYLVTSVLPSCCYTFGFVLSLFVFVSFFLAPFCVCLLFCFLCCVFSLFVFVLLLSFSCCSFCFVRFSVALLLEQSVLTIFSMSSSTGNEEGPPSKKLKVEEAMVTPQDFTSDSSAPAGNIIYVEPLELKTQSIANRKRAWLQWRENRREDRKWAFARLRDALALQDASMIDEWKNRMIELGPDDPDGSMPSFETTSCHS